MTWSVYGSYLVVVVLVVLAPGPDTMVMLKNALAGGFRGALMANAGILAGNLVQGSAAALGLSVLIVDSQPLFHTLRWLGVAYLCYLGFQALRGAWKGEYAPPEDTARDRRRAFRRFREGFLSNVTNPKVLVLYLSVLPQFLNPATTTTWDALLLAYTVGILGFLWLLLLMVFVHRVREWLRRRRVRRTLDAVTGSALIGFGTLLAVE
ncbi:LysE family translocator [Amycolatopsis suaedae]|uniref:LysE family translocator n=1 Tax=Amycolatopsis suaedae TaxID=2510978 RepID=A0A4Q7IY53_9PSEU|nr:LysE family translocator [Amycolatopsis suaedae]RZQ59368.1 LysE family translocator [Amycolatopsis suaedae]